MKAFLRWLIKLFSTAVILVLVLALLPYTSKLVAMVFPDESGSAIKASAIIASRLQDSARLETMKVEEDGVLNYDIHAALIGTVGSINVQYKYEASFGIDLAKVQISMSGNEIILSLPETELIHDSLTAVESYRNDFWYPGFSDDDYTKLLEDERQARRESYLSGDNSAKMSQQSQRMFESTVAEWIRNVSYGVTIRIQSISQIE